MSKRNPAERIEKVTADIKRMADNAEARAGATQGGPLLWLALAFCLWLAFQGTTKNGVVGCSDMPGGSNWEELTRPRR
jgi:hypothetical protein